ncbi:DNA ligase [compost metagenome]
MSKKTPLIQPDAHRAVNWNERAVQAVIDEHGEVYYGLKVDGMRAHLFRIGADADVLKVVTRAGHIIESVSARHEGILAEWDRLGFAKNAVIDAELHIPGTDFQTACGMLRRQRPLDAGVRIQFVVLDVFTQAHLTGEVYGKPSSPTFGHRLTSIARRLEGKTLLTSDDLFVGEAIGKANSIAQVQDGYRYARTLGYEGIIAKDPRAEVRNGKVSGQWKLKPGCGAAGWEGDGVVIGYVWGEAGKANEGKIVGFRVQLNDGSESNATGLTQALIAEYTAAWQAWMDADNAEWPEAPYAGRVARIEAMERTNGGSLRHPKFIAFRDLDSAQGDLA